MLVPTFVGGMPGGMELAVIVLNVLLLAAIAYALVAAIRYFGGPSSDLEERVANLEGQVAALREELQERDD